MDVQTTQGPMIANARVLDPPRLLYQGRQPTIVCRFRSHSYIKENTDINYSWSLLGTPRRCLEYVSTFNTSVCYHTYSFLFLGWENSSTNPAQSGAGLWYPMTHDSTNNQHRQWSKASYQRARKLVNDYCRLCSVPCLSSNRYHLRR